MSLDLWLYVEVDTGRGPFEVTVGEYDFNITHNVTPMWGEAGVFDALYESNGDTAEKYLDVLYKGYVDMLNCPEIYKALNPANGWGTYEGALEFLRKWIEECERHPKAKIHVCR